MLLTRSPLTTHPKADGPFDLHVLSTPPAFVLSQDQTLQQNQKRTPPQQHTSGQQTPAKTNPPNTQAGTTNTNKQPKHTVEFSKNGHAPGRSLDRLGDNPVNLPRGGGRVKPYHDSARLPARGRSRWVRERRYVRPGASARVSAIPTSCQAGIFPRARRGYPRSLACRRLPAARTVPSNSARGTS